MNDIINLNSIRSNNCDCNKPKKPTCGCNNHNSVPYEPSINVGDLYFKVKNLFGELRSEWQRAEARLNLGVTDIIDLRQILASEESGGTNIWEMTVSKGGSNRVYDFVVRNGLAGKSAKISFAEPYSVEAGKNPEVENIGNPSDVILRFGIPRGERGESGEPGESAFDIANRIKTAIDGVPYANEEEWIASLRGIPGEPGTPGESNENFKVTSINLIEYKDGDYLLPGGSTYSGPVGIWQVNFLNSPSMKFWVPFSMLNDVVSGVKILFKLKGFDHIPSSNELYQYLREQLTWVNSNDSGKPVQTLYSDGGWTDIAPVIVNPGYEFIYMATATIKGAEVGKWSVVQLTGTKGENGEDGNNGENPDIQGLVAPVIRLRGDWVPYPEPCYVNQSTLAQEEDKLRFIDVVKYNGSYWIVKASTGGVCVPSNLVPSVGSAYWLHALSIDFAYIDNLIANYINAHSIDTDEIRIHDRKSTSAIQKDVIVAGMTSGKPVTSLENIAAGTGNLAVRIWAGTNTNVLTQDGYYTLNLETAPFKVRLNGKLEASNADILGTILANVLRLGSESFESGNDNSTARILPKLANNKILMFYLLTDEMTNGTYTLSPSLGDSIKYFNKTTLEIVETLNSVSLKPKKLYLLFGIDHNLGSNAETHNLVWHLVELELAAIEVTSGGKYVDPSFYDVSFYVELSDDVNITDQISLSGNLVPAGEVHLVFTNRFSSPVTVYVSPINLTLLYSQDGSNNTTYAYTINIENFSFNVGKAALVSAAVGYGTKSHEQYTNDIGLNCSYDASEDLAGYLSGFCAKSIEETDFAEFDGSIVNRINIKKAVISATY